MIIGTLEKIIEGKVHTIVKHLHGRELWFGAGATPDSLTPYTLESGDGAFGAAVQLLAPTDLPVVSGCVRFDLHRVNPVSVSTASTYVIRIVWGTGTVAEAEAAKQYTTVVITPSALGVNTFWSPIPVLCPRLYCGIDYVWARVKNVTNGASIDILFGLHEYDR